MHSNQSGNSSAPFTDHDMEAKYASLERLAESLASRHASVCELRADLSSLELEGSKSSEDLIAISGFADEIFDACGGVNMIRLEELITFEQKRARVSRAECVRLEECEAALLHACSKLKDEIRLADESVEAAKLRALSRYRSPCGEILAPSSLCSSPRRVRMQTGSGKCNTRPTKPKRRSKSLQY